jgi:hypothetical protein
MNSSLCTSVLYCLLMSILLEDNDLRLGASRHEGSIPFTRFRPLVPRGLQRGRVSHHRESNLLSR